MTAWKGHMDSMIGIAQNAIKGMLNRDRRMLAYASMIGVYEQAQYQQAFMGMCEHGGGLFGLQSCKLEHAWPDYLAFYRIGLSGNGPHCKPIEAGSGIPIHRCTDVVFLSGHEKRCI